MDGDFGDDDWQRSARNQWFFTETTNTSGSWLCHRERMWTDSGKKNVQEKSFEKSCLFMRRYF